MADKIKTIKATDLDVNPVLDQVVSRKENPMKEWLVDYVGNKVNPKSGEVTVEMIIEAMTNEFPEFVLAVAEDNFLRGYKQGLFDLEWGRKAEKTEKTLKRQFGEKVVDAVMGAIEEGVEDNGGTD